MKVKIYGYDATLPENYQLRKNFKLTELANNQGNKNEAQFIIDANVDTFLDMLQEFRLWFAKPMTINSCYRQSAFNKKVGGDAKSAHLHACAVDWAMKGHTEAQRTNVKNKWADICRAHNVIGSINFYKNGYHLEAFSDKWYGQKTFVVRDFRGKKGDW